MSGKYLYFFGSKPYDVLLLSFSMFLAVVRMVLYFDSNDASPLLPSPFLLTVAFGKAVPFRLISLWLLSMSYPFVYNTKFTILT